MVLKIKISLKDFIFRTFSFLLKRIILLTYNTYYKMCNLKLSSCHH